MSRKRNLAIDFLVYVAIRALVCFVQILPLSVCSRIASFLAWLFFDVIRLRRKLTLQNLEHAFGDLDHNAHCEIARRMWRHLVLLGCELFVADRKLHRTNWHHHFRTKNIDKKVKHLLDDRPVVIVSGHFGNFEIGGLFSSLLGYPTFSIARNFPNPFLDRYVHKLRSSTGQRLLPKTGSSLDVDRVLSTKGTLMVLGDQSAGQKGCWVEFFGRPASCHKSLALFSLTQKAPMVVAYSKRVDDKPLQFEVGVLGVYDPATDGPMSVEELTQWHTRLLEEAIRESPEQYWWMHRRWRDPPARVVKRWEKRKLERQEHEKQKHGEEVIRAKSA